MLWEHLKLESELSLKGPSRVPQENSGHKGKSELADRAVTCNSRRVSRAEEDLRAGVQAGE